MMPAPASRSYFPLVTAFVSLVIAPAAAQQQAASDANFLIPNYASSAGVSQPQWFYAGATVQSVLRAADIPGRLFYAVDGTSLQNPFDSLQSAGFNAVRVETNITTCSGPSPPFDNSGNVLERESLDDLDGGCIDIQVQAAQLANDRNMKVVLTINMGIMIPEGWQSYNFAQMLDAIDAEVRRQIQPFLLAGVQPDIVLLGGEETAGMLYNVILPNGDLHTRGKEDNAAVSQQQVMQEVCGQVPTGNIFSYPQLAGYYKQEIVSVTASLQEAGFNPSDTRFGLHSHRQYVDFKQSIVYSTDPENEVTATSGNVTCNLTGIIPDDILSLKASDLLDIMGFSSYPEPMAPSDVSSPAAWNATFDELQTTLELMDQVAMRFGKYTSGPYAGQYVKQGLAVEYASTFIVPEEAQYQQQHTELYFSILQEYPWFLGALWYEPTYVYTDWQGGNASLYHKWYNSDLTQTSEAPDATFFTWGSFARSPSASS